LVVFIAFAGSMAILLGFLGRSTQLQLDADARTFIMAESADIAQTFDRSGAKAAHNVIEGDLRYVSANVFLLDPPGDTGASGNITRWPAGFAADGRVHRLLVNRPGNPVAEPFAAIAVRLKGGYRLLVGRSLAEQERLTATLNTSLLAAVALALVLAVGISALLARMASARIQAIADVAGAVTAGDLSRRVPVMPGPPRDAFDSLGLLLNTMLARIESLLDEFRALTDGLAHDLRSPLTRMKARIDRIQRSSEIGEAQIAAIGAEADALLGMLENSLAISRAEAGIGRDSFETADLAALAAGMAEMYEPLADESGIRLTITAPAPVPVRVHRALLGRALANLIDNALRHGATGGVIDITVIAAPGGARLSVGDHGPGIDAADRATALRRFGRLDAARSASGAGLGLSLAASIARLHGGTLTLSDNQPGLKVTIDLPAA
jgi:signal transduction histidine kinase